MLSFLSSAKNEIGSALFVFSNFSISQLIIIHSLYYQVYFLMFYINIIIPCLQKFQRNHRSEVSEFLESHPNYLS